MSDLSEPIPTPAAEPLFRVELGANGGVFAPTSLQEAIEWVQKESNFWSWIQQTAGGNYRYGIEQGLGQLNSALNQLNQAMQYQAPNPEMFRHCVANAQTHLSAAFVQWKLPHHDSALGKRIAEFRTSSGDPAASYFAAARVEQPGNAVTPQDLNQWHGFIAGLQERFRLNDVSGKNAAAHAAALDSLREKAEVLLADKKAIIEALHRDYAMTLEQIRSAAEAQTSAFEAAQAERDQSAQTQRDTHNAEMAQLRKTFNEEMALRAPAAYWTTKQGSHRKYAWITGVISFAGIGCAAAGLSWLIHEVLLQTAPGQNPQSWRVAFLVLVGVFSVWALRLVVRMFLSNLHLASDADERVVMVKTYLSLLEGKALESKEDRQLILQALFRPGSDGIVKDEGIPPSFMEFLTRTGGK